MFIPYSRRNRAATASDVFSYDVFPWNLRNQIWYVFQDLAVAAAVYTDNAVYSEQWLGRIQAKLLREFGVARLADRPKPHEDLQSFFEKETSVERVLDAIEIGFLVFDVRFKPRERGHFIDAYMLAIDTLNLRFNQSGIGYQLQDGLIVRVDSKFLHSEAVLPVLELIGNPKWDAVNREFRAAFEHYRKEEFIAAINECLKAFESTMKLICGKRHWTYRQEDTAAKLVTVCRENGLLTGYAQSVCEHLAQVLLVVASVRNSQTAHGQGERLVEVDRELTSFVLHSTAANILLLVSREQKLS